MKKLTRNGLVVAVATGGLLILSGSAAVAGAGSGSANDGGVLSGNDTDVAVNAPVTACGNAVAVAGRSRAGCEPGSSGGAHAGSSSRGAEGVLSGNDTDVAVNAPVTACGNAVAVAGDAKARCLAGTDEDSPAPGGDDTAPRDQLNGAGEQRDGDGLAGLAHTGATVLGALPLAGGLVVVGLMLYRSFRSSAA
ncbi:MAG: chaplin family protein [Carbonactinosporaceae bacterium]